jgi:hypothetical protein
VPKKSIDRLGLIYHTNCVILIRTTQFVLYKLYTNCKVQICTWCGFCTNTYTRIHTIVGGFFTNSYNFYTNCTVRIHTKCDFHVFSKSAQTSHECAARAARAKPELQVHSACRERPAQAARAKPELRARSASREGEARAHLLPRPGRTQLPRPLGYTRLPRPVRVRSWGGWVRNGIKVYNLYYRLPQSLGYTRLPRPLGYTRLPRYMSLYSSICVIRPSEK